MPTSSRFVVAVHALVSIVVMDGKPVRSEDIAHSAATGPVVIRRLLSLLSEAGLTTSQLGAGGGAVLAKPSDQIRLLDVYRAVEDTDIFTLHRVSPFKDCIVGSNIQEAIRPTLDKAQSALENELSKVTIADIAAETARLGKFTIPLVW